MRFRGVFEKHLLHHFRHIWLILVSLLNHNLRLIFFHFFLRDHIQLILLHQIPHFFLIRGFWCLRFPLEVIIAFQRTPRYVWWETFAHFVFFSHKIVLNIVELLRVEILPCFSLFFILVLIFVSFEKWLLFYVRVPVFWLYLLMLLLFRELRCWFGLKLLLMSLIPCRGGRRRNFFDDWLRIQWLREVHWFFNEILWLSLRWHMGRKWVI